MKREVDGKGSLCEGKNPLGVDFQQCGRRQTCDWRQASEKLLATQREKIGGRDQ